MTNTVLDRKLLVCLTWFQSIGPSYSYKKDFMEKILSLPKKKSKLVYCIICTFHITLVVLFIFLLPSPVKDLRRKLTPVSQNFDMA